MSSRREFVATASITAALAASGRLPLWAADSGVCYPAQGFEKFLQSCKLPDTSVSSGKTTYALVNMGKEVGQLSLARGGADAYVCDYFIKPGSACEAKFAVNGDLLSGVTSWTLTSRTEPVSKDMADLCAYTETGKVIDGSGEVRVGATKNCKFTTDAPLLPDWLLPLAAPMLPAEDGEYEFSLLREGTYFLGGQRLLYDGDVEIGVKGGKTLELKNYLHLGEGTLPSNYLVDGNGVTIIVTHGISAEVLR